MKILHKIFIKNYFTIFMNGGQALLLEGLSVRIGKCDKRIDAVRII